MKKLIFAFFCVTLLACAPSCTKGSGDDVPPPPEKKTAAPEEGENGNE